MALIIVHAPVLLPLDSSYLKLLLHAAHAMYGVNASTHIIEPALPVVPVTGSLTALPAPLIAATVMV